MYEVNINKGVLHILYKLENDTRKAVQEMLVDDVEFDLLVDIRDQLFNHAKERYEDNLKSEKLLDEDNALEFTAMRRNSGSISLLARDIIELYSYLSVIEVIEIYNIEIEGDCRENR